MFNRYWIKHVQPVIHWFTQAVTEPRSQLDRTERFVRYTYELGVHGWVALRRDNAPQMAAALSFRTLFALLPVIVVSTVLVRAVQGTEGFSDLVHRILEGAGLFQFKMGNVSGES